MGDDQAKAMVSSYEHVGSVPRTATHTELALRALEENLGRLTSQIDLLEGAVETVLLPQPPSAVGSDIAEPSGSKHATLLLQQANRISILCDRLGEITGRVDL